MKLIPTPRIHYEPVEGIGRSGELARVFLKRMGSFLQTAAIKAVFR